MKKEKKSILRVRSGAYTARLGTRIYETEAQKSVRRSGRKAMSLRKELASY